MQEDYYNELFTKWFNDDLSQDELEKLKLSPEFSLFQKIADVSSQFNSPEFNETRILNQINEEIENDVSVSTDNKTRFSVQLLVSQLLSFLGRSFPLIKK